MESLIMNLPTSTLICRDLVEIKNINLRPETLLPGRNRLVLQTRKCGPDKLYCQLFWPDKSYACSLVICLDQTFILAR